MNEKNAVSVKDMIYKIRGQKIMFDRDLTKLYDVELKIMNQAVKRNIERFPHDFMFQLTDEEWKNQRSQIVTSKSLIPPVSTKIVTVAKNRGIDGAQKSLLRNTAGSVAKYGFW